MRALRVLLATALVVAGLGFVSSPSVASSSVGGLDQCQNQSGPPYVTCSGWTNGALNGQNHYAEDMVVPQRALISVTDTSTYTFTTNYEDENGAKHGYDYLARWNYSITGATPCQSISASLCSGAPSTFPMASDTASATTAPPAGISPVISDHELGQADRQWTLYGGVITAATTPTHAAGTAQATISFHANPGVTQLVLLYGGHLAVGGPNTAPRAWGVTDGASSYPGGSLSIDVGGSTDGIQTNGIAPLPPAAFTIAKTSSSGTAAPGGQISYTVTVTNTGGQPGTETFTDVYDSGLTNVSTPAGCSQVAGLMTCTSASIPAGGHQDFTYTATMPTTFTSGAGTGGCATGTYPESNTATLSGAVAAGASPSATVVVCVAAAPAFTIAKTVSNATPAPGSSVIYTITVTNTGSAVGSTSFTDDYDNRLTPVPPVGCLPGSGLFTCTTGPIAAHGGTQVFSYTAVMPPSFNGGATCPGGYQVSNTATLTGGPSSTQNVCVQASPAFNVVKTVSATVAAPGQTLTYTLTVNNTGLASGQTSVTDTPDPSVTLGALPAGCLSNGNGSFTCTTGTILAGGNQAFSYTATMPATFTGTSGTGGCSTGSFPITNTAVLGTSTSSKTVCVGAVPNFTITKTVDTSSAVPGQLVHYTVKVKNIGAASGSTSFVDDYADVLTPTLPTAANGTCIQGTGQFSCSTGVVLSGDTVTFSYSATMPASFGAVSGGSGCALGTYPIGNTATLASGSASSQTVCVTAAPAFTITKTVDHQTVAPGATVMYSITVMNTGNAAGQLSFTDDYDNRLTPTVPNGCLAALGVLTCGTRTLDAGASQLFTYTAVVPSTFTGTPGGGTCAPGTYRIANSVTSVSGATASQDVCVTAAPMFAVTKTVDAPHALPGQTVHYTVTVTNTGSAAGSTTFVDDYDNRLTPTVPAGCTDTGGQLSCTTGTILAGSSQSFGYDATLPTQFSGPSGVDPCAPGEYSITNNVTISGATAASKTVCVAAAPRFTITKSVDHPSATPGQTVTYTVTVTNNGSVAGSTTFTDDYDNRLSPTVPAGCTNASGVLSCTTAVLAPTVSQMFTYSAVLPATYTGPSGGPGCASGSYPVTNLATLANATSQGATVCVAAAPAVSLVKTAALDTTSSGDQVLTYTLTYTNTGPAEATSVVVSDPIPNGTGFVSCSPTCSTGGSPNTATWSIGSIAPAGGTGSVVLTVKVTSNQACSVSNTGQIRVGSAPPISSNTVTTNVSPQPDPTNAKSSGSAVGLSLTTNGLLNLVGPLVGYTFTNNNTLAVASTSSAQNGLGGPNLGSNGLLGVKIPSSASLVTAGVVTTTSASSVTAAPAEAHQTSTAEVASVCLVPVAGVCTVKSDTVRAVASTTTNGAFAGVSTAGSTIQNLYVAGVLVPVDLNQTTTIPLNKAIFGPNSYVAINERTGTAGLSSGNYVADETVAMIHVKITGVLGLQAVEIYVAKAVAHSQFPKTFVCTNAATRAVSGHAYVARLYTGPLLADLLLGYTQVSPLGGAETEHIASVVLPSTGVIVNATAADSSSVALTTATSSTSRSFAEVAGDATRPACVLSYVTNCVVKATLIHSEARSNATSAGSTTTDTGTTLVNLSVLGIPISGTPAPNTTITLPGIGFIILNEQFCDNGALASHSCAGASHSGMTVRAIRIVITVANNLLGLAPGVELTLAEAHADTTFS